METKHTQIRIIRAPSFAKGQIWVNEYIEEVEAHGGKVIDIKFHYGIFLDTYMVTVIK